MHTDDISKRGPGSYCTFTGNTCCMTGFVLIQLPTDVKFQILQMRLSTCLINIYLPSPYGSCVSTLFEWKFRNDRILVSFFKRFYCMNSKNIHFSYYFSSYFNFWIEQPLLLTMISLYFLKVDPNLN